MHIGNPPDAPLLAPAVGRITSKTGKTVRAVAADRNYGEPAVETNLHKLGVTHVAIYRKGKPSKARRQAEHAPAFHRLIKWRTGCEGRISYLKHSFSCDRTLMDGHDGAQTWVGHGVLTHNLVKISALAAT